MFLIYSEFSRNATTVFIEGRIDIVLFGTCPKFYRWQWQLFHSRHLNHQYNPTVSYAFVVISFTVILISKYLTSRKIIFTIHLNIGLVFLKSQPVYKKVEVYYRFILLVQLHPNSYMLHCILLNIYYLFISTFLLQSIQYIF